MGCCGNIVVIVVVVVVVVVVIVLTPYKLLYHAYMVTCDENNTGI